MGGWITLTMMAVGMYRIAEGSNLPGWIWAGVTVGLGLLASLLFPVAPGMFTAGLAGVGTFLVMFGYKVAFDK